MFNLTKQERLVLLFLAAVMLVGSLLQILTKQSSELRTFFSFTQRHQFQAIDINTANLEIFKKIPYIGESTARAILQVRVEHGPFKSIEELRSVKGIGPRKFELIKPYIKVGP